MYNWILSLVGKKIAKKLDLQEGVVETKKWYQSKTILSDIVTILVALYASIGATLAPTMGWTLPPIPEWVFVILGAIGIYGRKTASATIEK